MAQSHHRKKHKEHLRQYQHRQENVSSAPKRKAAVIFAIVGVVIGLAVSYFASDANFVWIAIGAPETGSPPRVFATVPKCHPLSRRPRPRVHPAQPSAPANNPTSGSGLPVR